MLKKIIFANLLCCFTIASFAQVVKEKRVDETITDSAIIYPTEMERNYDLLLSDWGKIVKYADDCKNSSDDMGAVPDSVYIKRLYSLPTKMELVFNPIVRNYIEMYAGRRRNQVSYMLGEGKYYFPIFEEALDKEGLPLELKYLPVIESALNPIARSRVAATGLWQFMAPTGKMYDLEINSLVDERSDPEKSSAAAARFLKDLYRIYGDWNLVIAAYNCGPGNVNKAIRRSGGLRDYWSIYPNLPKETRGYVPAFIAATYIMSYHNEHNICPAECTKPASLDTLVVDKHIHMQQIADVLNIPIEDIRKYNPQYKTDIIPGEYKNYTLNLPINIVTAFIDQEDAVLAYKTEELLTHRKVAGPDNAAKGNVKYVTYKVKRGDTLFGIAKRYGVTVAQLKAWNGLKSNSAPVRKNISIYKEIVEPKTEQSTDIQLASNTSVKGPESSAEIAPNLSAKTKTKTETVTATNLHKIKKGENWGSVARKYKVSVAELQKWNGKKNKFIAGKDLKIITQKQVEVAVIEEPEPKISEPELALVTVDSESVTDFFDQYLGKIDRDASELPLVRIGLPQIRSERNKTDDDTRIIYHKVKIGETITQIATRYKVTKKDILSWNKLSSSAAKVGQRLLIRLPENKIGGDETVLGKNDSRTISSLTEK